MPKIVKKSEIPGSSAAEELKKFLMSGSGSKIRSLKTVPDMKREISPDHKENAIDEVLMNDNSNKKQPKRVAPNFKEPQQKFLNMIGKQSDLRYVYNNYTMPITTKLFALLNYNIIIFCYRKQGKDKMMRTLTAVVNQLEADLTNMREGVKVFQQRSIDQLQFLDQIVTTNSIRLQAVKDMSAAYKTKYEYILNIF